MAKVKLLIAVCIFCCFLTGCALKWDEVVDPGGNLNRNFYYEISTGGPAQMSNYSYKLSVDGPLHFMEDTDGCSNYIGIRCFKVYDDGTREEVQGYWSVEPSDIAVIRNSQLCSYNEFEKGKKGIGKIVVAVEESDTKVEREFVVYGAKSMGASPKANTFDFEDGIEGMDIEFDYVEKVVRAKNITLMEYTPLFMIFNFPDPSGVDSIPFSLLSSNTMVFQTQEGYWVKLQTISFGYGMDSFQYYVEKQNTSQFLW